MSKYDHAWATVGLVDEGEPHSAPPATSAPSSSVSSAKHAKCRSLPLAVSPPSVSASSASKSSFCELFEVLLQQCLASNWFQHRFICRSTLHVNLYGALFVAFDNTRECDVVVKMYVKSRLPLTAPATETNHQPIRDDIYREGHVLSHLQQHHQLHLKHQSHCSSQSAASVNQHQHINDQVVQLSSEGMHHLLHLYEVLVDSVFYILVYEHCENGNFVELMWRNTADAGEKATMSIPLVITPAFLSHSTLPASSATTPSSSSSVAPSSSFSHSFYQTYCSFSSSFVRLHAFPIPVVRVIIRQLCLAVASLHLHSPFLDTRRCCNSMNGEADRRHSHSSNNVNGEYHARSMLEWECSGVAHGQLSLYHMLLANDGHLRVCDFARAFTHQTAVHTLEKLRHLHNATSVPSVPKTTATDTSKSTSASLSDQQRQRQWQKQPPQLHRTQQTASCAPDRVSAKDEELDSLDFPPWLPVSMSSITPSSKVRTPAPIYPASTHTNSHSPSSHSGCNSIGGNFTRPQPPQIHHGDGKDEEEIEIDESEDDSDRHDEKEDDTKDEKCSNDENSSKSGSARTTEQTAGVNSSHQWLSMCEFDVFSVGVILLQLLTGDICGELMWESVSQNHSVFVQLWIQRWRDVRAAVVNGSHQNERMSESCVALLDSVILGLPSRPAIFGLLNNRWLQPN